MVFLGASFFSDENSLKPSESQANDITKLRLYGGIYDNLYVTTNTDLSPDDYEDEPWTHDTKIKADFDGDFSSGNSIYTLSNTDFIVIKRREKGTFNWITIYVSPKIEELSDLDIQFDDKYARANTDYEYAICSYHSYDSFLMMNHQQIIEVKSDFDGIFIADKNCIYGTKIGIDGCDTTREIITGTLPLLNNKYPTVVSNSDTNYDSGSVSGIFMDVDCEATKGIQYNSSYKYRNKIKDRLADKMPLVLKTMDGRMWLIKVTGGITDQMDNHPQLRKISFDWVEIGNVDDEETLYMNGLTDISSEWWNNE